MIKNMHVLYVFVGESGRKWERAHTFDA